MSSKKKSSHYESLTLVREKRLTFDEMSMIRNIQLNSTCTCNVQISHITANIVNSWIVEPKMREYKQTISQIFTACMPTYDSLMKQLIPIKGNWKFTLQLHTRYYSVVNDIGTPNANFVNLEEAYTYYVRYMILFSKTYNVPNFTDVSLLFYVVE